jgi:hypothetical protein
MGAYAVVPGTAEKNEAIAELYAQAGEPGMAAPPARLAVSIATLVESGEVSVAEDLYRASVLLAASERLDHLLLAHDCAMAATHDGFRPAARMLGSIQRRCLRIFQDRNSAARAWSGTVRADFPGAATLLRRKPVRSNDAEVFTEAYRLGPTPRME